MNEQEFRRSVEAIRRMPEPTREQIAQFERNLAAISERKLGRTLTPSEKKALSGTDKSLLLYEVIIEMFQDFTAEKLAAYLEELRAGDNRAALLQRLSGSAESLERNRLTLLSRLTPKAAAIVRKFDFDEALLDFSRWFLRLLAHEPPPHRIQALYFGLCERKGGVNLHVSGANAFDEEDSDWACANDWRPEARYAPIDALSKMWRPLRKAGAEPWVVVQAISILLIKAFFEKHPTGVEKLLRKRELFIASGFDDGDLYAIKTAFSPEA